MKKLTSWLLVVVMLLSCCTMIAIPAAAANEPFTNLYDDSKDGLTGRANENAAQVNHSIIVPYVYADSEYITTQAISVASGDKLYFGPANSGQGYQLYFYPQGGTPAMISASGCAEQFVFEGERNTQSSSTAADKKVVVFSYTAPSKGEVRITFPQEYHDTFVVTKNQPITYDGFYAYWDNKADANLWEPYLDVKYKIAENGELDKTDADHYATHYIAVKEGDTLTWGPHRDPASMQYGAVGYNANKQGVTGAISVADGAMNANVKLEETFTAANKPNTTDAASNTYGIYTYKVPAGVSYVRVLLRKEVADRFIVRKNNPFDVEEYWELMGGDVNSPYFGKTSVWFGDSISQGVHDMRDNGVWHGGWVGRVSKALNMTYDHNGESGWSLTTARPGRIVNRLIATQADEPAGGFDVVMLHGGTNDAWEKTAVGKMSDSYSPIDFDITTYAGALEELFYYATTLYGDTAEINYILNYDQPRKVSGHVYYMTPHYLEALKICEKWGVTPIDLFFDEAVREACALNTMRIYRDWCHASMRGYDILTPFIVDKMLAATTGNSWLEDHDTIAGKIYKDLFNTVFEDEHFTAESKMNFAIAAKGTNNAQKLAAALAAAPALEQVEGNYITVKDMTKYSFAEQTEFGVSTVQDLVCLSNYNNEQGNSNGKTVFGNLPGYIPANFKIHQLNDIDMNTDKNYNTTGYNTIGIGTVANPFDSLYDGHGYKILNFKETSYATAATALFPRIKNATIKNLTIEKANCLGVTDESDANNKKLGGEWTSILAGVAHGPNNLIQNCHVVDSTLSKNYKNGMAAILVQPDDYRFPDSAADGFRILDCTVSGCNFVVTGTAENTNIGWIASRVTSANEIIENCYTYNNTLTIKNAITVKAVGGMVSEGKNGKIINSGAYNNRINNEGGATIDATMHSALVGYVTGGTFTITNSYGDSDLPLVASGTTTITNSYSVKAGTTTAAEITNGTLTGKLVDSTNLRWVNTSIGNVSIPMVKSNVITLGGNTLYAVNANGSIAASSEEQAAVAGKIWRKGNVTLLTKDVLNGQYTENENWVEVEYLLGDCMGGNTLDIQDAQALLQNLIGKSVEGYKAERADMNVDGRVNLEDACLVLSYVNRGINA